jgi:CheY-like chemotaxis protein
VDLIEANKAVLSALGHEVVTAYSADEAREVFEGDKAPDLLVLDVMMEHETAGFFLAQELHSKLPKLPIIILSGINDCNDYPWNFGPDETWLPVIKFLDKPVKPAALAAEVKKALN